jgi:hypothetical protein
MLLDIRAEIAASPSQEALSRLGRIDSRDTSQYDERIRAFKLN